MSGDFPVTSTPSAQGVAGTLLVGGESITQICLSDYPIYPGPGKSATLLNQLGQRHDILQASASLGVSNIIGNSFTGWMTALSQGRVRFVKNAGLTGTSIATSLASFSNPASNEYCAGITPAPAIWMWQGAGGDDSYAGGTAPVITGLQAMYRRCMATWPNSLGIIWTQTTSTPNNDSTRRPVNDAIKDFARRNPVMLLDVEKLMINGYTGITASDGFVTITIANPGVFTFTAQTSGGSAVAHGLQPGDQISFFTTGALPTGLVAGTVYWVLSTPTSSTFQVSTTPGGAAVVTTGTQSGNQTAISPRQNSTDALHQRSNGAYRIAKMALELCGDHLANESDMINDYVNDVRITAANGGWAADATMLGTLGTGNTATNWSTTGGAGFTTALIPREDNYGNWQRVSQPAGQATPTQFGVYRNIPVVYPAGAIIQIECEVRWPFGDLVGTTDLALVLLTNLGGGGTGCQASFLTSSGQVPGTGTYETPVPGEKWVMRTVPIVVPTGTALVAGSSFVEMVATAVSGTMDVGRFSIIRLA